VTVLQSRGGGLPRLPPNISKSFPVLKSFRIRRMQLTGRGALSDFYDRDGTFQKLFQWEEDGCKWAIEKAISVSISRNRTIVATNFALGGGPHCMMPCRVWVLSLKVSPGTTDSQLS